MQRVQRSWLSLQEHKKSTNTLLCLLQGLEGQTTTIELINECKIYGQIDSVDGYSNVILSNAEMLTLSGKRLQCPTMFVQGRKIRYVHVPPHIDIGKCIERSLSKLRQAKFGRKK